MQWNQSLGQTLQEKTFGINFGYQLYVIVKILKCNMLTGAKNAMFHLFLSKAFILCTLMVVFHKDQIGKLLDLVGFLASTPGQ